LPDFCLLVFHRTIGSHFFNEQLALSRGRIKTGIKNDKHYVIVGFQDRIWFFLWIGSFGFHSLDAGFQRILKGSFEGFGLVF